MAKNIKGLVERPKLIFSLELVVGRGLIWMELSGQLEKTLLKNFLIEPGFGGKSEALEVISGRSAHALKLSPQEQEVAALGLVTLNPPPCKASLKSSSEPVT